MEGTSASSVGSADLERFRLRRFVDRLAADGMVEVHEEPVALIDLAAHLDGNARAVLFRKAGPDAVEIVGNLAGSRERIARAFDVPPRQLAGEILDRMAAKQPLIEIEPARAPVQQVVLQGDDADLTQLPVHLQHAMDGGPYISASIDFVREPDTGRMNVGIRRMMLRGRREAGIDLVAPSDLRAIYGRAVERSAPLPVSFVVGAHPVDLMAAVMRVPGDELEFLASMRGAPLPVVRCVTNDIMVPADAEIVLEGYLDSRGWVEPEGPYGEYYGYYGMMKRNPVFHLTAITRRRDALFQTATIGGRHLVHTETANLAMVRTEVTAWRVLQTAVREPVAVRASAAANGSCNVRVALRQRVPGEARNAIAALFGSLANIKHVFVVDDDIDIDSDAQMDWALSSRFQADRDLVVASGFRAPPLDPSLDGRRTWSKAGFDLTVPFGKRDAFAFAVAGPPKPATTARHATVEAALRAGPMAFGEIMSALASRDGREIVRALDDLRSRDRLTRLDDGRYALVASEPGAKANEA